MSVEKLILIGFLNRGGDFPGDTIGLSRLKLTLLGMVVYDCQTQYQLRVQELWADAASDRLVFRMVPHGGRGAREVLLAHTAFAHFVEKGRYKLEREEAVRID